VTLRIDVVTIFPDYFSPLDLSLIGKATEQELVSVSVHDLREVTTDRHRTVDDTPYGGGAGMVMMPEPWGVMLDSLLTPESTLVVPTPAGVRFTQSMAEDFSGVSHLVFACGRYEGIDQRVIEYYRDRCRVVEVSIGDYVLNGGEVATLVMLEATIRLVPGVLGNPESLVEESHQDGLVEYPSYTKPAQWRGLGVPDVLLSGNHGDIAAWREQQSRERTKRNRPDLLS
jgi:tRNA (guanine37-N1)-methyltransferase